MRVPSASLMFCCPPTVVAVCLPARAAVAERSRPRRRGDEHTIAAITLQEARQNGAALRACVRSVSGGRNGGQAARRGSSTVQSPIGHTMRRRLGEPRIERGLIVLAPVRPIAALEPVRSRAFRYPRRSRTALPAAHGFLPVRVIAVENVGEREHAVGRDARTVLPRCRCAVRFRRAERSLDAPHDHDLAATRRQSIEGRSASGVTARDGFCRAPAFDRSPKRIEIGRTSMGTTLRGAPGRSEGCAPW